MNVSTITLLFKAIPGYMFRLDLVILRPILTFVLPDTVHTLGSHRPKKSIRLDPTGNR